MPEGSHSEDAPDSSPAGDASAPPTAATAVFGPQVEVARAYHQILATDGIDHGLIGPREVPRLWDRHILNCAVIGELITEGESVVDVGSGAGLPGIPLAIARPDLHIVLLEPLLRRSAFLERAVERLGLPNVRVVRGRAEEKIVRGDIGEVDVATSRAVAPLDRLSKWSAPLVRVGGRMIAIKGSSAADEIERDGAAADKVGITNLVVRTCGEDVLHSPTTVVVGTKAATGGSGRKRKR